MRPDIDCLRNILITISNNLIPDDYGNIIPINPVKLAQSALSQYPQNEVLYWIRKLIDSNIIIPGKKYINEPLPAIRDLSISGYQFIEATKNTSIWEKVKPKLLSLASSSVSLLIKEAIELGTNFIA